LERLRHRCLWDWTQYHLLTTRPNGLEQCFWLVAEQHQRHPLRRLLERLEQGLLRGFQHCLGIIDDEDSAVALQGE
jgi:hypothetical protein